MPVVAKCSYLERGSITRLFDAGVMGIQLPMTETADNVSRLIGYMKFPPVGNRAFSPGIGNTDYEPSGPAVWGAWIKEMNEETVLIANVESKTRVENIDEILAVPEVDVLSIGVFDLMVSLEKLGKLDDPLVMGSLNRLIKAAHDHSKLLTEACKKLMSQFPGKK